MLKTIRALMARLSAPPQEPDAKIMVGPTLAGPYVHDDLDALSFAPVWACVRVVAETLASMPWHTFRRSPAGGRQQFSGPLAKILSIRPNPEMTAFALREHLALAAQLWGNAYCEIERDRAGRPVALWPIEPHRVSIERSSGRLVYRVHNPSRDDTFLRADNIYHIHGPGATGLCGYYVVALFRQAIGLGLATEQQAATFFGNQSIPGGFLKHAGKIETEKAKELIEQFEATHRSAARRGRIGLLQGGLEYEAVAVSNEDSELKETRTFQILEACRIFRVPPHKVGELSRATFSNISEQETSFARDTIMPWAVRMEQEADQKLAADPNVYTKLNLHAIMRGDPKANAEYYEVMQRIGALTVNEILELEDRNTIGPDGDKRLVPANYTTLGAVGEPPPPPVAIPPDDPTDHGATAPTPATPTPATPTPPTPTPVARTAVARMVADSVGWWADRQIAATDRHRKKHLEGPTRDTRAFQSATESLAGREGDLLAGRLDAAALAYRDLVAPAVADDTIRWPLARLCDTFANHYRDLVLDSTDIAGTSAAWSRDRSTLVEQLLSAIDSAIKAETAA